LFKAPIHGACGLDLFHCFVKLLLRQKTSPDQDQLERINLGIDSTFGYRYYSPGMAPLQIPRMLHEIHNFPYGLLLFPCEGAHKVAAPPTSPDGKGS